MSIGELKVGRDNAAVAGRFENPLESWPNDDLLLTERARAFFGRHYPTLLPLLDWPELRNIFAEHDHLANSAQRRSRRFGLWALSAGFLSLATAVISPVLPFAFGEFCWEHSAEATAGGASAVLAVVGVALGYWQVLWGRSKRDWITHRFWTERLRQLYFQLLIANVPVAVQAVAGDVEPWLKLRSNELDKFLNHTMSPVTDAFERMLSDMAEDHTWLSPSWVERFSPLPASEHATSLVAALSQQRIGIQQRYATFKLRDGFFSPATRGRWVRQTSDFLTAIVLVTAVVAGCCYALGANVAAVVATTVGGLCSMMVVALRVLNEGLQFDADAERYAWYHAAVDSIARRFEHVSLDEKVESLRDLEETSYREMRSFFLSINKARFLI